VKGAPPTRDPVEYFSTSYPEAAAKFLEAAEAAGAVELAEHPLPGTAGEPLHLAAAWLGPRDARDVVVIISGTHGVEGYAGSGLQVGLLRQPELVCHDRSSALLAIHLVNPWGLAWHRREDHENVDVFRNLLYADAPSQPDPLFDEIDDAMDLAGWARRDRSAPSSKVTALVERYGQDRIIAAIRRGQHHRPTAMSYHGNGPCWSTRTLRSLFTRHLAEALRITVIDIHTGFGEPGGLLVMSYERPGSDRFERVRSWMGGSIYSPGSDADIPAHPAGPFRFIEQLIPGSEVTATIFEFGTEPPEVTRELFPANHYHHLFGDPRSTEAQAIGLRYRRFCYPETAAWKRAVWENGARAFERIGAGVREWSTERS
jgi:hypothetical protein